MGTTTTPEPDREPASGLRSTEIRPDAGRDDRARLILTTDQLLGELLKRPGQLFVIITPFDGDSDEWRAFIEFADGDQVEVQRA